MPIELVWNTTEDEHGEALRAMFQNANKFHCAVAFVKASGFNMIEDKLEAHLRNNHPARLIIGLNFYQTDPYVLQKLLQWRQTYGHLELYVSPDDAIECFHPKIYAFNYPGNQSAILVGSANMTAGGFGNNWECSLKVAIANANNNPWLNDVIGAMDSLIDDGVVNELTQEVLDSYTKKYKKASALVPLYK
nr:phospholipase D family protein [Rhodospirillales bacterium]